MLNKSKKRKSENNLGLGLPEAQLTRFVDESAAALALFDKNMCYLAASDRWFEYHCLKKTKIIGQSHYDIFPDIPDRWKVLHRRGLNGETLRSDEDRFERADGSIQWIRWEIRPWHTCDGDIGGIVMFCENITQRKQAEEKLMATTEQYKMLFENSRDALIVFDSPTLKISSVNDAAVKMFGAESKEELMSLTPFNLSPPLQPDGTSSIDKTHKITSFLMSKGTHFFEWEHKRMDGSVFTAEVLLSGMKIDGHIFALASIRDISDRKKAENTRMALREEAESMNKQQIAAETAAAFAHQLNQPLQAISSYCNIAISLMDKSMLGHEEIRKVIHHAEVQALHAGESIQDLIDVLANGRLDPELFDLHGKILRTIELAKSETGANFVFHIKPKHVASFVYGNRIQIQKVLYNLIQNSVESMHASRTSKPEIDMTLETKKDEGMIELTIHDNGPGFSTEAAEHLFTPFFSTKEKGLGMGLLITRSLIEANGGNLWINPSEGPGAFVHLTLPLMN